MRIKVIDGVFSSATNPVTGDDVSADDSGPQMTVDELMDLFARAFEQENSEVKNAQFERDLGYPISASIDWIVGAIDDEVSFTVTNFRLGDRNPELEQLQQDFNHAMSRWGDGGRLFDTGIQNYQFTFRWQCFCPPETNSLVRIEVEGNEIRSVVDAVTGLPVEAPGGL